MADNVDSTVRAKIDALIARARADDAFAFELTNAPEATLQAEGFGGEVLEVMAGELGNDDVAGYVRCDRISCLLTSCTFWTD
jgi:hypothetical protein